MWLACKSHRLKRQVVCAASRTPAAPATQQDTACVLGTTCDGHVVWGCHVVYVPLFPARDGGRPQSMLQMLGSQLQLAGYGVFVSNERVTRAHT
jgi:hypothetical protein